MLMRMLHEVRVRHGAATAVTAATVETAQRLQQQQQQQLMAAAEFSFPSE